MRGGWHHTEKAKQKICEGNIGKCVTEETRQKMREIRTGTHLTEETIEKIREGKIGKKNPFYGKHHTEETKKRQGHHHTEEERRVMSERMMGNTNAFGCRRTEEYKKKKREAMTGKNHHSYGKHRSQKIKDKIGKAQLGEKNHNWNGGKSFEPYPIEWTKTLKESIRQRDKYLCQKCGIPQRECFQKLSIHHIDYDKENLNPKNLISLCRGCNTKVNSNREVWKEYFENRLKEKMILRK